MRKWKSRMHVLHARILIYIYSGNTYWQRTAMHKQARGFFFTHWLSNNICIFIGYDKTAASTFPPAVDSHNRVANEIRCFRIDRIEIERLRSDERKEREGTSEIVIRKTKRKESRFDHDHEEWKNREKIIQRMEEENRRDEINFFTSNFLIFVTSLFLSLSLSL